MGRITRYQGAIIRDDHILLIQQREYASGREYWLIPGGGREDGESEEQCVRREMKEETHLEVMVERLLLDDEAGHPGSFYRRYKTYLCRPVGGKARPGHEPEFDVMQGYEIAAVKWFDLRSELNWDKQVIANPFTYPLLQRIRAALGYGSDGVL